MKPFFLGTEKRIIFDRPKIFKNEATVKVEEF
jgi:hypothetical protein